VPHPDVRMHADIKSVSWPRWLCRLLGIFVIASWAVACAGPSVPRAGTRLKIATRAFFLCLDRSSSMNSPVADPAAAKLVIGQLKAWTRAQEEKRRRNPHLYPPGPIVEEPVSPSGPTRFQLARY